MDDTLLNKENDSNSDKNSNKESNSDKNSDKEEQNNENINKDSNSDENNNKESNNDENSNKEEQNDENINEEEQNDENNDNEQLSDEDSYQSGELSDDNELIDVIQEKTEHQEILEMKASDVKQYTNRGGKTFVDNVNESYELMSNIKYLTFFMGLISIIINGQTVINNFNKYVVKRTLPFTGIIKTLALYEIVVIGEFSFFLILLITSIFLLTYLFAHLKNIEELQLCGQKIMKYLQNCFSAIKLAGKVSFFNFLPYASPINVANKIIKAKNKQSNDELLKKLSWTCLITLLSLIFSFLAILALIVKIQLVQMSFKLDTTINLFANLLVIVGFINQLSGLTLTGEVIKEALLVYNFAGADGQVQKEEQEEIERFQRNVNRIILERVSRLGDIEKNPLKGLIQLYGFDLYDITFIMLHSESDKQQIVGSYKTPEIIPKDKKADQIMPKLQLKQEEDEYQEEYENDPQIPPIKIKDLLYYSNVVSEPKTVLAIDLDEGIYQRYYIKTNEWTIEKHIKDDILTKFDDNNMKTPLISTLDLGVETVYVCTGESGINSKEAEPNDCVIILNEDFTKVQSIGKMKNKRSMHKQTVIMNTLCITGGAIQDEDGNLIKATNTCEQICLDYLGNIMNAQMESMKKERRSHGMCSLVLNHSLEILVGMGYDGKVDTQGFELYDMKLNKWFTSELKNKIALTNPGFVQSNEHEVLILGGYNRSNKKVGKVRRLKLNKDCNLDDNPEPIKQITSVQMLNNPNIFMTRPPFIAKNCVYSLGSDSFEKGDNEKRWDKESKWCVKMMHNLGDDCTIVTSN